MFTLTKHPAKITHLNVREEKHGEEDVLALDIKVNADLANEFLDQLSPGLKAAVYDRDSAGLDLDDGHLAVLRFPQLAQLGWTSEMSGASFIIHGGRKSDDIEFNATINNLRLIPKQGGTVSIIFRAQVLPDPVEVGTLTGYLNQDIKVSVAAPAQPAEPPVE
jgi:hypothetical protein